MVWNEVCESGDYSGLLKDKGNPDKYAPIVYKKLQDEIIDTFGISDRYRKILRKMIKIEMMYLSQHTQGKANQLLIDIEEEELSKMTEMKTKTDIYSAIISVSKNVGSLQIDPKTLTVYEFYKITKALENGEK